MLTQSDITRVTRLVKQHLPAHFDHEDLALEILFESWLNKIEFPSPRFIYQRCLNASRDHNLEIMKLNTHQQPIVDLNMEKEIQDKDEVNLLVSILSPLEKKIIWYRYYQELPMEEISRILKIQINQLRDTLQLSLYKMRSMNE